MLKVAVDIRDLEIAKTGTLTFMEGLISAFGQTNDEVEFVYFKPSNKPYTGNHPIFKIVEHINFFLWKQVVLPYKAYRNKCDIVFCSDFFVPYFHFGYKTVVVFHDAFFAEYPTHYNKYWLLLFKYIGLPAARRASYVVTPTAYAKKTVNEFYQIHLSNIVVIGEAGKEINSNLKDNEAIVINNKRFTSPFALHVGTFEKRKNLPALIEAISKLEQHGAENLHLVLVGKSSNKVTLDDTELILETIQKLNVQDRVHLVGFADSEKLALFYGKAMMYVFPSMNEGFGIPILEAFQFNVPVLVANNTCLPEVAGDAAICFDPFNSNAIADAITRVYQDPVLRNTLITNGQKRLKDYSWKITADRLIQLFKNNIN
jgi:glycosyltransferase involved in cell wall biosynthesis